jgi:serine/threonine-protein kinase RsbW
MQMSLTLPREAVSVPLARGLLAATLERAGVTADVVEDIKVALTEACTNAYQHVDAGDTYEVVVGLDDEYLTLQVIDHGPGFEPRPPPPGLDMHAERGRGLELIRALTDTAAFGSSTDDGGELSMWKRVAWGDRSPWLTATQEVATHKPKENASAPEREELQP